MTVTGSVNTNETGLYILTYSATNTDGFSATTTRTVVVIASNELPTLICLVSSDYVGSSTYTSTVTKVAEGTYTTDNAWSGPLYSSVFCPLMERQFRIPDQSTAYGAASGTGTYNGGTGKLVYTISIPSQGLNNINRNWQRQ